MKKLLKLKEIGTWILAILVVTILVLVYVKKNPFLDPTVVISGVSVNTDPKTMSGYIRWVTDRPSFGQVEIGLASESDTNPAEVIKETSFEAARTHTVFLTDLRGSAIYTYTVSALDESGKVLGQYGEAEFATAETAYPPQPELGVVQESSNHDPLDAFRKGTQSAARDPLQTFR